MLNEIVLALLILPLTYFTYRIVKCFGFVYLYQYPMVKDLPGPKCYPVIGSTFGMARNLKDVPKFLNKFAADAREKGYSMFKLMLGPIIVVLPIDHESVKGILNSNELHKGKDYKFFEKWMGPGLILGAGERWKKARRLATPAFHFAKLEEYSQTMDFHCQTLIKLLGEKANGQVVDIYNDFKLCALDIIAETTMGVKLNAQMNSDQPYVKAVGEFNHLNCTRSVKVHLRPQFMWRLLGYEKKEDEAVEILHAFTNKVIKERMEIYAKEKEKLDTSTKTRPNFLDMMLQLKDAEQLSDLYLREEADNIMFAGHDTTAHALSWSIWCFATHPGVQEKAYNELIEHFGHSDTEFYTGKIKELKYLDQCVKEVLRLRPSVPAILRFIHNEIEMGGRTIPAKTSVSIPIVMIHQNPTVFEDPEKFDPDRFAEDRNYPHLSYIPFSAGPRNCVGQKFAQMEIKITLAHLLYNFKFETDLKFEDNKIMFEVVLRPSLGVPVKLSRR